MSQTAAAAWMCVEPDMSWEKVDVYSAEQVANPSDKDKPFTVYKMVVTTEDRRSWEVSKTFAEFVQFREQILANAGKEVVGAFHFPPRSLLVPGSRRADPKAVLDRMAGLQRWMTQLIAAYPDHVLLGVFLEADSDLAQLAELKRNWAGPDRPLQYHPRGWTKLHSAAHRGDARWLAALLADCAASDDGSGAGGGAVDALDCLGRTPLQLAAAGGHPAAVAALLGGGAAVERANLAGQTALHQALSSALLRLQHALLGSPAGAEADEDAEEDDEPADRLRRQRAAMARAVDGVVVPAAKIVSLLVGPTLQPDSRFLALVAPHSPQDGGGDQPATLTATDGTLDTPLHLAAALAALAAAAANVAGVSAVAVSPTRGGGSEPETGASPVAVAAKKGHDRFVATLVDPLVRRLIDIIIRRIKLEKQSSAAAAAADPVAAAVAGPGDGGLSWAAWAGGVAAFERRDCLGRTAAGRACWQAAEFADAQAKRRQEDEQQQPAAGLVVEGGTAAAPRESVVEATVRWYQAQLQRLAVAKPPPSAVALAQREASQAASSGGGGGGGGAGTGRKQAWGDGESNELGPGVVARCVRGTPLRAEPALSSSKLATLRPGELCKVLGRQVIMQEVEGTGLTEILRLRVELLPPLLAQPGTPRPATSGAPHPGTPRTAADRWRGAAAAASRSGIGQGGAALTGWVSCVSSTHPDRPILVVHDTAAGQPAEAAAEGTPRKLRSSPAGGCAAQPKPQLIVPRRPRTAGERARRKSRDVTDSPAGGGAPAGKRPQAADVAATKPLSAVLAQFKASGRDCWCPAAMAREKALEYHQFFRAQCLEGKMGEGEDGSGPVAFGRGAYAPLTVEAASAGDETEGSDDEGGGGLYDDDSWLQDSPL